ncbi:MAG TPA: BrnT family toxin [Geminicoccaceae bacterium]|nr:BrnT family toxin [Geminicoccus sp.]HMU50912.1 BrnT family toxin [Geminicoccaceae bacterium]
MQIDYTWDTTKERANRRKHGISFYEAIAVLRDVDRVVEVDDRQDYGELRLRTLGRVGLRVLVVITTQPADHEIRIISARKANRYEQKAYHQSFVGSR